MLSKVWKTGAWGTGPVGSQAGLPGAGTGADTTCTGIRGRQPSTQGTNVRGTKGPLGGPGELCSQNADLVRARESPCFLPG